MHTSHLSYWEQKTWFRDIDFAIIGSGIVGLSCALSLRKKYPDKKIVVFERGRLPSGASSKNAGFACFGSISEILDDLNTHSEEEVIQLVRNRLEGLELLKEQLGATAIDFKAYGGYELFTQEDTELYETCLSKMRYVNELLKEVFLGKENVFSIKKDVFSFQNIQKKLIFNQFEGQIDTGKMIWSLIQKCSKENILIVNSTQIDSFSAKNDQILLASEGFGQIETKKLFIATNGFAAQIVEEDVKPARAQVIITQPISNLKIKGTFHLDKGYYYFRNIDNRILFGGGRNLDIAGETTAVMEVTALIQNQLESLLRTTILPNTTFKIDSRWSGIMGVGNRKQPLIKELQPNVYCGVRLGGMGVAIGSSIGKQLANLESKNA